MNKKREIRKNDIINLKKYIDNIDKLNEDKNLRQFPYSLYSISVELGVSRHNIREWALCNEEFNQLIEPLNIL